MTGDGNGVTIEKIDEAEAALKRVRRVELVLIIVAAAGMTATGIFSAWAALRVQSCTTPEGKCYRETTVRARESTKKFLEDLDAQHSVIKCLLLIPPLQRTTQDVIDCGG